MTTTSTTARRFVGVWLVISPMDKGMNHYDGSGHMVVQSAPGQSRP